MPGESDRSKIYSRLEQVEKDMVALSGEVRRQGDKIDSIGTGIQQLLGRETSGKPKLGEVMLLITFITVLVGGVFTLYDREQSYFRSETKEELAFSAKRIESLDTRSDKREHLVGTTDRMQDSFDALERRVDKVEAEAGIATALLKERE